MKKISVIMPVYNVEKYVREAIESVLNQSYKEFELIIVNDGSKDNSGIICEEYSYDKRVKYIKKENGGLSSARNAGLAVASGEYITFIDSDDLFDIDYLSTLVRIKEENNADLAVVSYYCFSDGDSLKPMMSKRVKKYSGKKYVHAMFGPQMIGAYAWGKLFSRDCFETRKFPEGKLYEDILTTPYIIYPMNNVVYSFSQLYMYRQREGSILNKFIPNRADELLAISKIVDLGIVNKDRTLTWFARINEVRSYLENKHRFKKFNYDFSNIEKSFSKRVKIDCIKILLPWIL